MKKVIATLLVLASVNAMAKSYKVCPVNDIDLKPIGKCRTITDSRELGQPSRAAEQQCTGEGTPCVVTSHSNGYVPVLSELNRWFRNHGAQTPAFPGDEAP